MELNNDALSGRSRELLALGYELPCYDREIVAKETERAPEWIHFGAGNIFRAFIAELSQTLLNGGHMKTGILVAEGYDEEILDVAYRPYDNLAIAATLCAGGDIRKTVVGSIAASLTMNRGTADWAALEKAFAAPTLKMVSLTITEKGYNITDGKGEFFPAVAKDMTAGPGGAESYTGRIAALCHARYLAGRLPLALVSMDNCSHNGSRLEKAMVAFAEGWEKNGLTDKGFTDYIKDRATISFPWSMIDKITPRPDDSVREMLEKDGFFGMAPRITAKRSFVAPFVNAEEAQYLVIEDAFPNGKLPLDKAGVIFTERETVDLVETMKVATCLNPLHTALAVLGCLLGYTRISAEMKDEDLKKIVEIIGYQEGLPVVADPGVIDPRAFIDEVINTRFPNPFLQDTPQRIATDTSQKICVRFGKTIQKYAANEALDIRDLRCIAFVIAAWCRYLTAVDDNGEAFTPSDDPLMAELAPRFTALKLGADIDVHTVLEPVLRDARIMSVDLYEVGLGETVEKFFAELMRAPGAVRARLHRLVTEG